MCFVTFQFVPLEPTSVDGIESGTETGMMWALFPTVLIP